MKNTIKKIISLLIILLVIFSFWTVQAKSELEENATTIEYSEDYKAWLNLSEEDKKSTLEPRKYDIVTKKDNISYLKEMDNVFKIQQLLRANLSAKYDLRDIIPENVKIRNQMQTNSCWAFATTGILESHLGLKDKNSSKPVVAYDLSEKHMNYGTAKSAFLDGKTNEYGFAKEVSDGGNFYLATQYMANGLGAIDESDLPFVNSEEDIDISEIQNKEVKTTLYDTVEFPSLTPSEREEVMPSIKQHIVNYGGVYASVHGAAIFSNSYNNETGAIYCTSEILEPRNHAVVIIGWDDNYSKDNFKENHRPEEDGAWIIKNSWGESISEKISVLKESLFEAQQSTCEENGWYSPEEIPTEVIVEMYKSSYGEDKVSVQGEDIIVEIGNKGYMYISYEDCNVYRNLIGIEKATYSKDYDNVYQNDMLGPINNIGINSQNNVYMANVFTRDSSVQEVLDKITIYTFQGYTCKVLVNPNNNSKNKNDLQEVELKDGNSETIEPGYHTIEFAEPVKLTGDSFVVVVQLINNDQMKQIALESKIENSMWEDAIVNSGESFCATETDWNNGVWTDLATMEDENLRGNLCIKAYTTLKDEGVEEITLTDIYISTPPTKTEYIEGENFNKSGMKVMARYSDDTTKEITNYSIIGGENLTIDKTNVIIQYTEDGITKTVQQAITVKTKEEPTDPEEPETPKEEPTLSDFTNAKSDVIETKMYFNSKDILKGSCEITVKTTGIKIGDESNTYTYYYYMTGTQGEENIENWTKAESIKENDGTYSVIFKAKSDELQNYAEIVESDNLYIYLKEIAELEQQSKEQIITLSVDSLTEPECYIDGEYVGGIEDVLNYIKENNENANQGNEESKKDNTVASGILPHAGSFAFKVMIAILIVGFGGFAFYRYKNIDR